MRAAVLVTAAAGVMACAEPPPPPVASGAGGFAVTDSAGVEIVTNAGPRYGETAPIALGRRAAVRIGSLDGDDAFGRPTQAVRLSDGRILVLDSQTQEILVFDEDGGRVGVWGGEGGGPGEFVGAWTLDRLPGDTVAVIDRRQLRTTLLDPEGELVRTFRTEFDFEWPRGFMAAQSCCVPEVTLDGERSLWRYPQIWSDEGSGDRPITTTAVVAGVSGTDTLGVFPSGIAGFWPNGVNPVVRQEHGWMMHFGARDGRVVVARGDRLGWQEYDPDSGELLRAVRAQLARRAVSDEDEDSEVADSPEMTPELRGRLASRPVADSFPAFDEMVVGQDGSVWLYEPTADRRSPTTYHHFSPEGEWLGRVTFPQFFWARDAGEGWVLGRTVGEYDESYVELWTFDPPPG